MTRRLAQKCISFLLLLALAAAALTPAALAAEDPVDDFAAALGSFQEEITVPVRDFEALMKETFTRYPELYFYYGGCTYLSVPDGLELTVSYQNTQVPREQVQVVRSDDELMAVMGLALADKENGFYAAFAPGYAPGEEQVAAVVDRLNQDYYLLWMGLYRYSYSGMENQSWDVRWYEFTLNYWQDVGADTLTQWRDGTEQALLQLSATLFAQDMPDYQKVLLIHDYLVDSCRYDTADLDVMDWENHIAYGALVEGSCVCQGYAEAARLLMDAAGVESVCVTGTAGGEDHMWNAVQLDGQWYMMDPTWDDPITSDGSDVKLYDYFLITSAQLAEDHQWDTAAFPECTATDLNYETVRQLVEGDSTEYTGYSTDLVRTQAIERAELEAILAQAEPGDTAQPQDAAEPEDTAEPADVTEPQDTGEPEDTAEPDNTTEPGDTAEPGNTTEPGDTAEPDDATEPGDTAESDDTAEPDDAAEPDDSTEPGNTAGPEDEPEDQVDLQLVIPLREEGERRPVSLSGWLIAALIVAAVAAGLSALVFHCVSASRVANARERREEQRKRRLASGKIRRRER